MSEQLSALGVLCGEMTELALIGFVSRASEVVHFTITLLIQNSYIMVLPCKLALFCNYCISSRVNWRSAPMMQLDSTPAAMDLSHLRRQHVYAIRDSKF